MRKRSAYRPRRVNYDVMGWVMSGFKPVSTATDTVLFLRTKNHGSMERLCKGLGDMSDVIVLTNAFITTQSLAEIGTGRDWLPEIEMAQEALLTLAERGERTGRLAFTGPELSAINLAMEVHDAQLDGCTIAQFEKAINRAMAAIRHNHPRACA